MLNLIKWRRLVALLLLANNLWLSVGCWNWKEINDVNIVLGLGVDWNPKTKLVETTVQVANPAGGSGGGQSVSAGGKPYWVLTSDGLNLFDAIRNGGELAGSKLYFAHVRVILIGEEMAKQGIGQIVDFFDRDAELRNTVKLVVVKGKAQSVLSAEHGGDRIPSDIIAGFLKANAIAGKTIDKDVLSVLKMVGRFHVLGQQNRPYFMLAGVKPISSPKSHTFLSAGSAVLCGECLVDWLPMRLTRGHNWIENEIKSTILVVDCPEHKLDPLALEVIRSKTQVEPILRNGRLEMDINVTATAHLGHSDCPEPLLSRNFLFDVEEHGAKLIRNEIRDTVNYAQQELQGDVFGFYEIIHRKYPELWHQQLKPDWNQQFAKLPVRVSVKLDVAYLGNTIRFSIFKSQ